VTHRRNVYQDDYVKLHIEGVFNRAASRIVFRRSGKASHPSWPDLFRPSTSFLATLSDKRVVQITDRDFAKDKEPPRTIKRDLIEKSISDEGFRFLRGEER
jgi:hypothetical protein